jgi:hypothetical protein
MFVWLVSIVFLVGIVAFLIFAIGKKRKGEDLGERNQQ